MKLDYEKAKKLGEREYRRRLVKGQYPYLPSLDEMVSEIGRMPEISLGTAEIPMDMMPQSGAGSMIRRSKKESGIRSRSMNS